MTPPTTIKPRRYRAEVAAGLSANELAVAQLMAEGLTVEAIAEKLCLSVSTVRNYGTSIRSILGVNSRHDIRARLDEEINGRPLVQYWLACLDDDGTPGLVGKAHPDRKSLEAYAATMPGGDFVCVRLELTRLKPGSFSGRHA